MTANVPKRASKSSAALKILIICVLGSTKCHTNPKIAATSNKREINDRIPPNIGVL
jgi:hypothetical protein